MTLLSAAKEANFGGSAINSFYKFGKKLFWVSTISEQLLGFSRIYYG